MKSFRLTIRNVNCSLLSFNFSVLFRFRLTIRNVNSLEASTIATDIQGFRLTIRNVNYILVKKKLDLMDVLD